PLASLVLLHPIPAMADEVQCRGNHGTRGNDVGMADREPAGRPASHAGANWEDPAHAAATEEVLNDLQVFDQAAPLEFQHGAGRSAVAAEIERSERPAAPATGGLHGLWLLADASRTEAVYVNDRLVSLDVLIRQVDLQFTARPDGEPDVL